MGALVQLLPHHLRLRPAKGGSAPSLPCPWLPDRCPVSTHHQPLLALRPAEWLASRPGPPPSRWQRLLRPSFLPRRSPHGEVGYHYGSCLDPCCGGTCTRWESAVMGCNVARAGAHPAPWLSFSQFRRARPVGTGAHPHRELETFRGLHLAHYLAHVPAAAWRCRRSPCVVPWSKPSSPFPSDRQPEPSQARITCLLRSQDPRSRNSTIRPRCFSTTFWAALIRRAP